MVDLHQIGEVADRTGLSLRTIRYYEELGLVVPSTRTAGGFRLYTDDDIARLILVKAMKPLDMSLDTTRKMLAARDRLACGAPPSREGEPDIDELTAYLATATRRLERKRSQLGGAEDALHHLRLEIERHGVRAEHAR